MGFEQQSLLCAACAVAFATWSHGTLADETPKVPTIVGEYIAVYRPAGDRFPGPDTPQLRAGQYYPQWVPNDHTIMKGEDQHWHAFGITHPLTTTENVHEGEFQSFHAVAPQGTLREVLRDGVWKDHAKILPPSQRPGEILENHAPYVIRHAGEYVMLYGPSPIRWATSRDLADWSPRGPIFRQPSGGRDPSLLLWQDKYYLVCCVSDRVEARVSADLADWSAPYTIVTMRAGVAPESPTLVRYDQAFYLFVCGWDGNWDRKTIQGAYQHITYVYRSDDPLRFDLRKEVTRLQAHAPEVFQDEAGNWYISSAEWPQRGVSIARLEWR